MILRTAHLLVALSLALILCLSAAPLSWADDKPPTAEKSASAETSAGSATSGVGETQPAKPAEKPSDKPSGKPVDPHFASPRATVRWFLSSFNAADEHPERLDDAVACLDPTDLPPSQKGDGGRLAFELERILHWIKMPTRLIPDAKEGSEYTLGDKPGLKVTLRRQPDGRWLFDAETVAALPKMGVTLYRQNLENPPPKDDSEVPADFQTPQAMFHTFVEAAKRGSFTAAAQCLDLSDIPAPAREAVGRELAVKLKEILDRTLFVIYQDVPSTALGEPLEAVVRQEGRIVVERQSTGPRKGQWLFTRGTVELIDRLYDAYESKPVVQELADLGLKQRPTSFRQSHGLWLRERLPDWLKTKFALTRHMTIRPYQLLGLAICLALVYPIFHFVKRASVAAAGSLDRWRNGPDAGVHRAQSAEAAAAEEPSGDAELVNSWARPLACLAALSFMVHGVASLDLDQHLAGAILSVLMPLDWLVGTLFFFQLVDPAIRFVVGTHATRPGSITRAAMGFPVISLVLKFAVIGFGLSAVLELFSFDVKTVLAGLGIGGLAFALAAQDTLKNFFGSIMLIWDRTFRVGDRVQIGGHEGAIESVGLRTTRIRGLDDSLLTIPNSDLTTEHVTNFGARRFRRFRTSLAVPYDTPLEQIIRYRDGVNELIRKHPAVRLDRSVVAVNDLGPLSIEILLEVFFDVPGDREELSARDGLILDILRLGEQLGISQAAPGK